MRFHPHTAAVRKEMLDAIGVASVDELYKHVPAAARMQHTPNLPTTMPEMEVEQRLSAMAAKNLSTDKAACFLGAGCYQHHIPATVDHIIQRGEFLTAYTPYQPEVAQGTLAVIFQFQSMIAALTGQEIANASMYDGATSVAEAALMTRRITRRNKIILHGHLHPHYEQTLRTVCDGAHVHYNQQPDADTACVVVQTPDYHGTPQDLQKLRDDCRATGALLVVAVTEILSLGLLPAPVEADIVAGEAQSIGVGMNFGGPHLGFFACKKEYLRQMPGRLCGESVDEDGKRSYVLTLSTREQHIRREKATSNICSNQGLMALAFTVHLSLLGENGFHQLAKLNHAKACELADTLATVPGVTVENKRFFNEFVIHVQANAQKLVEALANEAHILAGVVLDEHRLLVCATEMNSTAHMQAYAKALAKYMPLCQ